MVQPVIRIYLTAEGVQKVDAPVEKPEDRDKAFELTERVMPAIRQLSAAVRNKLRE